MFKCEKCGAELEPNAKFCTSCGEKVSENIKIEMKNNEPLSKVKTWILKAIAFFIAGMVWSIARITFAAINGESIHDGYSGEALLLFIGLYMLLKGLFLKDSSAKKRGGWILAIYLIGTIALTYYMNKF